MRRSAYYSRNNSYSKSYNAEIAESNGRYPLTRAAQYLGLSSASFKAGCKKAGITTSEWHHVGKYANRVDYWDTVDCESNPSFWIGAITKANKKYCLKMAQEAIRNRWQSRLSELEDDKFHAEKRNSLGGSFHDGFVNLYRPNADWMRIVMKNKADQAFHNNKEGKKDLIVMNANGELYHVEGYAFAPHYTFPNTPGKHLKMGCWVDISPYKAIDYHRDMVLFEKQL